MKRRMKTMGERLRRARIDAGWKSASSAAKSHGWATSSYIAHENGQNDYDPQAAELYAAAFKTTPEWLLLGKHPTPKAAYPGIDAQILTLPKEEADKIIEKFNAMLEGVRIVGKIK